MNWSFDNTFGMTFDRTSGFSFDETFPLARGPQLDIVDNLNGSITVNWGVLGSTADSYNVYVNDVLNQNVQGYQATITGLTRASYANGVVTPSSTYEIKVVAVSGGVEIARSAPRRRVTPGPTSVMLTTPMRRPFPFPATGMDNAGYGG